MKTSDFRNSLRQGGLEKSYTVAFGLRTGSTFLCERLAAAGCGRPTEYFQYPFERNSYFASVRELSGADQLQAIFLRNSCNAIFGSKMTHDHRARLEETLTEGLEDYRCLDDVLPHHRWIYLVRRSLIDQALSLHVAEASGAWHMKQGAAPPEPAHAPYDFYSILSKVMILAASNLNWDTFFEKNGIQPLRIVYEDFADDAAPTMDRIFKHVDFLSADPAAAETSGGLVKIAELKDVEYRSHKERFVDEFLRIGETADAERHGLSRQNWNAFFFEKKWLA